MSMLRRPRRFRPLLALVGVLAVAGCSTTSSQRPPLSILRDTSESAARRLQAVSDLRAGQGAAERIGVDAVAPRDVYKEIAWTTGQPAALRAAVVDALLNDKDEAVVSDAREMAKMMLPKEGAREVVVTICRNAGTKGWSDFTPSIVRAYSRTLPGVEESDRVERRALQDLNPGRSVEEVVFGVFLDPPKLPPTEAIDWTMRHRADAWNVLARIDPDGTARASMMDRAAGVRGDAVLDAVRAARADLRAVPVTGDELTWLASLRSPRRKEDAGWWKETAAAVAKTPSEAGDLRLRHLEAIRWTAAVAPERLSMSRDQLALMVQQRLHDRVLHQRSVSEGKRVDGPVKSERFERRLAELSWADLIAIIAIDEAIRQPHVVRALFAQARADRADTSTEYGGLVAFRRTDGASTDGQADRAVVMLYMPRSSQRRGDTQFVASDEMLAASDHAIAHYHFHVQKERNAEYAGPSDGDFDYATRHGRGCLVFTSVGEGVLAVDYYHPGDLCIDLGTLSREP
ncbi:MAG: hypothetical protein WCK33_07320 [Phycisphaerae bacterium]